MEDDGKAPPVAETLGGGLAPGGGGVSRRTYGVQAQEAGREGESAAVCVQQGEAELPGKEEDVKALSEGLPAQDALKADSRA